MAALRGLGPGGTIPGMAKRALILVDLQNDFCPGGALEVAHGDEVVEVANRVQKRFELVVATQDWHPADHGSFAANHPGAEPYQVIDLHGLPQVLWPVHCVQDSDGARFHADLQAEGLRWRDVDPDAARSRPAPQRLRQVLAPTTREIVENPHFLDRFREQSIDGVRSD